jgi:hypothetical protein
MVAAQKSGRLARLIEYDPDLSDWLPAFPCPEEGSWLVRPARHGSPNLGFAAMLSLAKGLWWREAPTICRCTTATPYRGFSSTPIF